MGYFFSKLTKFIFSYHASLIALTNHQLHPQATHPLLTDEIFEVDSHRYKHYIRKCLLRKQMWLRSQPATPIRLQVLFIRSTRQAYKTAQLPVINYLRIPEFIRSRF